MTPERAPRIAVGPERDPRFERAVTGGGGVPCGLEDTPDALVWTAGPQDFPEVLPASVRWVQLPSAGVEYWLSQGVVKAHPRVTWTSAAAAYSTTVAEHALLLLLAGVRALPAHLAATSWTPESLAPVVGTLRGATVGIIGAGGVGRALIPMLAALGARALAVTRSGRPVPGAIETFPVERIDEIWPLADHFVISATATLDVEQLVGATELAAMKSTAWVVNVARGDLVDTDALVAALRSGAIGGAGLDVTDPEPLPDDHPLWTLPNAVITPHDANPPPLRIPAYLEHVTENVTRFASSLVPIGVVDPSAGY
ncbi:D-isomer specific 2-hydroxyacid dehydrogenase family protein [Rhodococcus rhodochrous]|uniref:D-isomer specific 2-hydroxyacid dehydrogenase family protein n=1 Tax=Rhodococcus rhodochrous TaxID=1829 RepID=UPI0024B8D858|nr:D-isomer specific 2-hydroxyacid dehydrogenase family protein [Rhodococcus rhodochrous]MDJ0396962.1 D-isomer specific 2-hydroxyacid dehydrogenase family protein [Rhodococcus rhodochrous]